MKINDLKANWNEFGNVDPLWSILTQPDKKNRQWDEQEFFATGKNTIARKLKSVEAANIELRHGKALDFGCGVGRLTQALCEHFETVNGVDIADSMIAQARNYNRFGERCQYFQNSEPNLTLFASNQFDFIFTMITLQHIEPMYVLMYLSEFVRLLAPGGLALFHLPQPNPTPAGAQPPNQSPAKRAFSMAKEAFRELSPPIVFKPVRFAYRRLRGLPDLAELEKRNEPIMEMHGIARADVETFIASLPNAELRAVVESEGVGAPFTDYDYFVVKTA